VVGPIEASATFGTCMVNTDLSNPTSNKIYQELGYRPVGDWQECSFAR
jgi:uncharacterized protein